MNQISISRIIYLVFKYTLSLFNIDLNQKNAKISYDDIYRELPKSYIIYLESQAALRDMYAFEASKKTIHQYYDLKPRFFQGIPVESSSIKTTDSIRPR